MDLIEEMLCAISLYEPGLPELARKSGVSNAVLYRFFTGKRGMNLKTAAKLAKILKITLARIDREEMFLDGQWVRCSTPIPEKDQTPPLVLEYARRFPEKILNLALTDPDRGDHFDQLQRHKEDVLEDIEIFLNMRKDGKC